jgi:hypothetical protein
VTQLQIWQDHRFFIVQQSELWVWVSEKFQFSIFLPCKRSRNFVEKISGLYSVLSRVFTDKKFFENVIALRNTFSGDMFVWVPSLSHNRRNGGHFANVKVRHSKTSKCLYERFFCGWRSVESWKTLRRIFTFRFRALQRKLRCIFFRRIFWNDRDQKFYRGVCSGKVYLKNPIYDISRIRLTSYRSTQVLIDIEIQFSIVWYAQISTSHLVAESKLFHWTNFDVFEKTSSSFCVKRKRQPRYLFFFLFEEGGSVAGQSATIRFGRGRRPRGPTYARGTIRSLFEDQEQATQRTAYDVATRPPCRNLFWGRSFRNNSVCLCRQSIHFEFIGSGFIFVYRITFSFISVSLSVSLSVFVCFFRGFFRVFIVESLCQPVLGRLESHMLAPKF